MEFSLVDQSVVDELFWDIVCADPHVMELQFAEQLSGDGAGQDGPVTVTSTSIEPPSDESASKSWPRTGRVGGLANRANGGPAHHLTCWARSPPPRCRK